MPAPERIPPLLGFPGERIIPAHEAFVPTYHAVVRGHRVVVWGGSDEKWTVLVFHDDFNVPVGDKAYMKVVVSRANQDRGLRFEAGSWPTVPIDQPLLILTTIHALIDKHERVTSGGNDGLHDLQAPDSAGA
jgi:hypothetical protein